jgi:hypothetical protein
VLRSRDRTGSYLISLCVGAALFGLFFFLTIVVQNVWGLQPAEDRHRVPANNRHGHTGVRDRVVGGAPHRRPAADDRRQRDDGRRDVLAICRSPAITPPAPNARKQAPLEEPPSVRLNVRFSRTVSAPPTAA